MINAGSLVHVFTTAGDKICSLTVSMDQQGAEGRKLLSAILLIVPPAAEIVVIDQAGMQINQKIHDDQQWADKSGTTILTVVCRRSAPTEARFLYSVAMTAVKNWSTFETSSRCLQRSTPTR
jgi:hypothetical protein